MERTPLFAFLRRSLDLAIVSLRSDAPLSEVMEETREVGRRPPQADPIPEHGAVPLPRGCAISRRQFLGAAASAGALLTLQACGPRPLGRGATSRAALRRDEPVVVVGAGIAGLTAAYRLKQAGVRVRLLEAQARVGGRIFSLRDHFPDGQVVELGGELIDTNHSAMHALAAELGLELDDLALDVPADPPRGAAPTAQPPLDDDVWYFDGRRRSDAQVVEAFRPVAARILADLERISGDGTVSHRAPNGAEPLDRLSIAEWLDHAGVHGWFRDLLDVGYATEYGLPIEEQSALNLLLMIDPEPDPFRIYGESDERFHVRGGNDLIPRALAAGLEAELETGVHLEAVSQRADGTFVCSVRRDHASTTATAPWLVLAIPFTLLRSVRLDVELPPVKRRAIAELGYGTNAKLMVAFSERVWRTRHRSNGSVLTDLPFQLTWETSRRQPGRTGVLTNFTGGARGLELGIGSPSDQARRLVRDLERVYPGVLARRDGMPEARFHWPSHPYTLGSYACYRVGQWTSFGGEEGTPVGRLLFAGEHCSPEAQGYMEGGCRTGEEAARIVLAELGVARPAAVPPLAPPTMTARRGRRARATTRVAARSSGHAA